MTDQQNTNHPYSIPGLPPIPFEEDQDDTDRGETIYAVMDLGRPNEDPTVDRAFKDERAAQHHKQRIQNEAGLPSVVIPTQLE